MGEIKMNDPDLREIASALRYLAGRDEECSTNRRKWGEIAAAIEEQVKPAIEEPTEFGSIVRARSPQDASETVFDLWTPTPRRKHYWMSQSGLCEVWSELTDVEVLRVGVGGPEEKSAVSLAAYDEGYGNGQYAGFSQALEGAANRIRQLRAEAITSERKSAYDTAIKTVDGLQP